MELKDISSAVIDLVKKTGIFIENAGKDKQNISVESKGKHNYVTQIDKQAEEKLVEGLLLILPEAGFIAEEGTSEKKGERYNWIIDPIDGTTNFIHGLPPFAVSVALMDNQEIVIGVIYEVGLKECFYTWKDAPAYMNGKEIRVSETKKVTDSLIATGFPYTDYDKLDQFMITFEYFMRNSRGLRRLGSAATDIAYVACGRLDGFYEYGLNAWDVAAGVLLVKQAGGKVSDFAGGEDFLFGREIITTNADIFDEFQPEIDKVMNS